MPHPTGIPKTLPEIPEPTLDLGKAQDLGVIGETPKPRNESTPQEAAHASVPDKTMAAEQQTKPEDVIHGPSQMRDKAGNIRLDQIGINGDAKDIIVQAAESNNDFMNARQGNVRWPRLNG